MMNGDARDGVVRAIADEIVRATSPLMVVLFGSRAKGTARPDSDVDLLVVEDVPFGPGRTRMDEMARLWRLLAHFRVPKDILVVGKDDVAKWKNSLNHVVGRALREGVVLYERP